MGLLYEAPPRWNRLVAMTRDCKSLGFGLRRFESYFQHQYEKTAPKGLFFLKNESLTAFIIETDAVNN